MIILSTFDSKPAYNVSCRDGSVVVHMAHRGNTLSILQRSVDRLETVPPSIEEFETILRKLGSRRVKGNRWGPPPADALERLAAR
ncbi:hypothetical protein EON81_06515 [bacterium]|nr:MAG: hypothetical protein EON81_06515 [bacterium]